MAAAIAQETADYIGLHRAAVAALAASPGLLDASPTQQQALLRSVAQSYPDLDALTLLDAAGNRLASSDDEAPTDPPTPVVDEVRRTGHGTSTR